jgi:hypothetical protein
MTTEVETDDDGVEKEAKAGVTSERRRLEGGGVLKRGLEDVALLTAFLARVSTKLDLMARDTDDKVARRRQEGVMGEGETVGAPEDIEGAP